MKSHGVGTKTQEFERPVKIMITENIELADFGSPTDYKEIFNDTGTTSILSMCSIIIFQFFVLLLCLDRYYRANMYSKS